MSEEMSEIIAKVHDDIEGRYTLDSYDKGLIHNALCELAKIKDQPSQDELWEELDRECIRLSYTGEVFFLTEEAKKRYQITKKRQ